MNNSYTRVLSVYKWATMGGVERVLLNRAHAFKSGNLPIKLDVFFFHDGGGLARFIKYIDNLGLNDWLQVVDEIKPNFYDLILPIDTPEVFDLTNENGKIFMECHTSYTENRYYLKKLPSSVRGIIVPSESFKNEITSEVPETFKDKIHVLKNCIPNEVFLRNSLNYDVWNKTPIAYVGRIDKLKNVEEVMGIFSRAREVIGDYFILLVAGPITPEVDFWKLVDEKKIKSRLVYLPPIDFSKVPCLLSLIYARRGIFISSSKNESFGLSVAEAMTHNIPVLLSSNIAHSDLVEGDTRFLYKLGDINDAVEKLGIIMQEYDMLSNRIEKYSKKYKIESFLTDWRHLLENVSETNVT